MNWLRETLSDWRGNPSTKRHVIAASAAVLCLVSLAIGLSCAAWVYQKGDLGAGAVGALTCALGILAGLAGSAYHKKEAGIVVPPASGAGAKVSELSTEATGAKIEGQP
ncbi:MAG: hypothetical protein C0436_04170 [Alphaproteobacteria bacterium]|nr:hypothetical protein [Alphaproteobacteria bacterium]